MNTMSSISLSNSDKQALRLFLTAREVSALGTSQLLTGQIVSDRQDRMVLTALMLALVRMPAASTVGKPNPGKMNFEHYFNA